MAHKYGPVPVRYGGIFDYVSSKEYVFINVEEFGNNYWGKCFYKPENRDFNRDLFSDEELESLKSVRETFKGHNATEIKVKSHEEKAWLSNEKNKSLIDYSYSFDLLHL